MNARLAGPDWPKHPEKGAGGGPCRETGGAGRPVGARASRSRAGAAGFTLIEVVLSLAITGMLLAGVFAVAQSATSMADEVASSQERAMLGQSFTGLLRRTFEQVPGNAKVELKITSQGSGGAAQSDIIFRDYPLAFAWAGVEAGAKTVIFRTQPDARGALAARILYLNEDQAEAYDGGKLSVDDDTVAALTLVDGLRFCQWYFWDERTEEWVEEWDPQKFANRRPSLVNLYLKFFGEDTAGENVTFWIPTMVNPSTYAGTGVAAGGAGAGGAGPGGPGRPGGPGGPGGPGAGPGGGRGQPGMDRPGGGRGGRGGPGGGGGRGPGGGGGRGPGGGAR